MTHLDRMDVEPVSAGDAVVAAAGALAAVRSRRTPEIVPGAFGAGLGAKAAVLAELLSGADRLRTDCLSRLDAGLGEARSLVTRVAAVDSAAGAALDSVTVPGGGR